MMDQLPQLDMNNMTEATLSSLHNDQLVKLVMALKEENDKFKLNSEETLSKKYDERLERLEREINKDRQYARRETIELVGIPDDVDDADVEAECINILKSAKVKVGNKFPSPLDIHAAHRKGRKGTVILKFVNRKFAIAALSNRASLKGSNEYGNVFINQSLCPEFQFLNYAVRKAKRNNEIDFYKVKNGVTLVRKEENGQFIEISHVNDLGRNGITIPERSY